MFVSHDFRCTRLARPAAVAIGNFDGVHRGHQSILQRAVSAGSARGLDSLALTFEPHPTRVLAPERASAQLTPLDRKLELLSEQGLEGVLVQTFDQSFRALTPEQFVTQVLGGLGARFVVVGADFHFGKGREGNAEALAALGRAAGFEVTVAPPVLEGDGPVSSSRVRKALAEGDLGAVGSMLGRAFDFDGLVVHGDARGRTLGFPTANLRTATEALPRDGVYAVTVQLAPGGRPLPGVMNLGVRPTVGAGRAAEVHLLDFDGDLYSRCLRVTVRARLRDEQRFASLGELQAQLHRDVLAAREALVRLFS